jgi:hypothetical protein
VLGRNLQKRNLSGFILVFLVAGVLLPFAGTVFAVDFYLDLETDPGEVLIVDPTAVEGEGFYSSGSWVVIDAKQTVLGEGVRYEFLEWSTTDTSAADPELVDDLSGNEALIFMDGDRVVTAIYQVHYLFYLDLETDPAEVLVVDPFAVEGEGYYPSGSCVIIDAKNTVVGDMVVYQFDEWSAYDPWVGDPSEEPSLTGTQAFAFMDSDRTVVAFYEEIFVGVWECSYEDDSSGYVFRVSTDDEYFQFWTPQKAFSIKQADNMYSGEYSTAIAHLDETLMLLSFSISSLDYCVVFARDMQTGETYFLVDGIGVE